MITFSRRVVGARRGMFKLWIHYLIFPQRWVVRHQGNGLSSTFLKTSGKVHSIFFFRSTQNQLQNERKRKSTKREGGEEIHIVVQPSLLSEVSSSPSFSLWLFLTLLPSTFSIFSFSESLISLSYSLYFLSFPSLNRSSLSFFLSNFILQKRLVAWK